ncbi:MAG: transglycosylase domain-containing protein [Sandaracinaceae bacterium]|nr:transglycosylase domain-containing protein [Sandaracinaceae bacterium]
MSLRSRLARGALWAFGLTLGALTLGYLASFFVSVDERRLVQPPDALTVLDREGVPLRQARVDGVDRRWVALSDVSPRLLDAIIAAEDGRFRDHVGVDLLATVRALGQAVVPVGHRSGASTITQQTIKLTHGRPHGLWSKPLEVLRALALERMLSKDEILEQYVNRLPYGDQIVGVARASEAYFGVPARDLGVAEAALIAGIPRAPSATEPRRHLAAALVRRDEVLRRMHRRGFITEAELEEALASQPRILTEHVRAYRAARFVDRVMADHRDDHVPAGARSRGRVIHTSLDATLQEESEELLRAAVTRLEPRGVRNAAGVVIDAHTGELLAYVGAAREGAEHAGGQLDLLRARRQPGSTLKPFAYSMLFESGGHAATLLDDTARGMTGAGGTHFEAENYDGREHGPVRARAALSGSLNLAALDVVRRVGTPALVSRLRDLQFDEVPSAAEVGAAVVLGGLGVSPLELGRAYTALVNDGRVVTLERYPVEASRAHEPQGDAVQERAAGDDTDASDDASPRADDAPDAPPQAPHGPADEQHDDEAVVDEPTPVARVFAPAAVAVTVDILADGDARRLAFGRDLEAEAGGLPFGLKTGTSSGYHDAWAVAFDAHAVVVVWLGDPAGGPLERVSGFEGAAPVAARILSVARQRRSAGAPLEPFAPSLLTETVPVCALSGELPHTGCPTTLAERFVPGHVPDTTCAVHGPSGDVHFDERYTGWALSEGWLVGDATRSAEPLRVVHPSDAAEWWVDPLRPIPTELRANVPNGEVRWEVDGRALPEGTASWLPVAGAHRIVALRGAERAEVTLTVHALERH